MDVHDSGEFSGNLDTGNKVAWRHELLSSVLTSSAPLRFSTTGWAATAFRGVTFDWPPAPDSAQRTLT